MMFRSSASLIVCVCVVCMCRWGMSAKKINCCNYRRTQTQLTLSPIKLYKIDYTTENAFLIKFRPQSGIINNQSGSKPLWNAHEELFEYRLGEN